MRPQRTHDVLSRHKTSEGVVTYTRDDTGRIEIWLDHWDQPSQPLRTAPATSPVADDGLDQADCA